MHTLTTVLAAGVIASASLLLDVPNSEEPVKPITDVGLLAADLGITAESLAIAGVVSSTEVETIFANLQNAEQLRMAYDDTLSAIDAAGATLTALSEALLVDPTDNAMASQYVAVRNDLESARQSLKSIREALLFVALDGQPSAVLTKIQSWRASASRAVPPAYRAVQRTDEEWLALESALRAKARAAQFGTELKSSHANLLNDVEASSIVIQATVNLAAYLSTTKNAVDQALEQ